jgi:hypothetical protein
VTSAADATIQVDISKTTSLERCDGIGATAMVLIAPRGRPKTRAPVDSTCSLKALQKMENPEAYASTFISRTVALAVIGELKGAKPCLHESIAAIQFGTMLAGPPISKR